MAILSRLVVVCGALFWYILTLTLFKKKFDNFIFFLFIFFYFIIIIFFMFLFAGLDPTLNLQKLCF